MLKRIRTAESYELHCGLVKNKAVQYFCLETVYESRNVTRNRNYQIFSSDSKIGKECFCPLHQKSVTSPEGKLAVKSVFGEVSLHL